MSLFNQATPIWLKDRAWEMNCFAEFEAETSACNGTMLLAVSGFYRLWVNGHFVAFGPARTAKGYARVDRIPVSVKENEGGMRIRIEAVNYCCAALSTVKQPGFLCAELQNEKGEPLLWTGRDFRAFVSERKLQHVERYSMQRHFGEVWDERPAATERHPFPTVSAEQTPAFLERRAPYPNYHEITTSKVLRRGVLRKDPDKQFPLNRYSNPPVDRFAEEEIPYKPYRWIQQFDQIQTGAACPLPAEVRAGEYLMFDLSEIQCGFLKLTMQATEESDVVLAFSEYCRGEAFEFSNINCQNVIEYLLPANGRFEEQSFEPYTLRFAILAVKSGSVNVQSFDVKTYERDMTNAHCPPTGNALADAICRAAKRTFAHNAVDIFSDCPSRERAGWLCDSYFTGKAEHFFFGDVPVESDFLENYRLYQADGSYPQGILPMVYPSDPRKGKHYQKGCEYIPQWNLWYILEAEEYLLERCPSADRESFRQSIYGILAHMSRYENADELPERPPGWNFVEWSAANDWTEDVNFPTALLYARALDAANALYGDRAAKEKADRIRKQVIEQAFDGEVFCDHAVRNENGVLVNQPHVSEACQYYAILFGGFSLSEPKYAKLLHHVKTGFKEFNRPGIETVHVNAFIGLYLRMEVLRGMREYELIFSELGDFFGGMVEKTGTLWEYRQYKGSYDHGFASYLAEVICEAAEGLRQTDKRPESSAI